LRRSGLDRHLAGGSRAAAGRRGRGCDVAGPERALAVPVIDPVEAALVVATTIIGRALGGTNMEEVALGGFAKSNPPIRSRADFVVMRRALHRRQPRASGRNFVDRSPYDGLTTPWRPNPTSLRGRRVFESGQVLAQPSAGRFVTILLREAA
jgi:hypothetical protein